MRNIQVNINEKNYKKISLILSGFLLLDVFLYWKINKMPKRSHNRSMGLLNRRKKWCKVRDPVDTGTTIYNDSASVESVYTNNDDHVPIVEQDVKAQKFMIGWCWLSICNGLCTISSKSNTEECHLPME